MKSRHEWMRGEIEAWMREGLVPHETAERLLARYPAPVRSGWAAMRIGFAALSALLVGGGIILLLAHNWADLSRPLRTALALAPLLAAQSLALFLAWRGRNETAWREGVGVFWTLSVGAAIAMVGQIYHLPGSFDSFMLSWMLLALPIAFVLCSALAATIYLAGVVSWSVPYAGEPPHVLAIWPLVVAVVPLLLHPSRRNLFTPGLALMRWVWVAALTLAPVITLSHQIRGAWIPIYGSLFSLLWLIDERALRRAPSLAHRPMRVAGALGLIGLALILSYEEPWRVIAQGGAFAAGSDPYWMVDAAMAAAFAGAAIMLLAAARNRLRGPDWFTAAGFLLALAGYALARYVGLLQLVPLLFSAYVFLLGAVVATHGVRLESRGRVNAGLALMAAVIALRFFDRDLPLAARGLVFVALGLAFFAANFLLSRRLARSP